MEKLSIILHLNERQAAMLADVASFEGESLDVTLKRIIERKYQSYMDIMEELIAAHDRDSDEVPF